VTTLQPDWKALTRAIGASQRAITEGLAEFVRLDTVTQNPDGVRTGALWLAQAMRSRGLSAEVMETGGNPVVYGALPLPGARRTVLIYCHYDTKPAPAAGWLQPSPFSPILRRGTAEEGAPILELAEVPDDLLPEHRLYGRGSSDDKGPIWAHLTALELMRAQGMAPRVNLKLIFDGEEETGSQHFGSFTEAQRDLLAADVALVMDGSKDASGRPTVAFGARGVLSLELTLETARRDVHSGNFSVPNPAWRLVGLLASMAAPDGTPLVEGLEDGVVPPTAAERALMDRIPLDRAAIEKELGVALPSEYLERLMFRSTLTIRGLKSGFTGREAQTIIPHQATVAFDARLVKNQRVDTVYQRILDHIRAQGFTVIESADAPIPDELRGRAIRVVEQRGYDPAKTPADLPISRVVIEAVERAHGGEPAVVLPTMGGSVPLWAFTDILACPPSWCPTRTRTTASTVRTSTCASIISSRAYAQPPSSCTTSDRRRRR
jgi:acetylornithine deacetylase/succinyl-diaminopimelate desuccinylase-like protein